MIRTLSPRLNPQPTRSDVPMAKPTCATCAYFDPHNDPKRFDMGEGDCRRHAARPTWPTPEPVEMERRLVCWPLVRSYDFCGEHLSSDARPEWC